MGRLAEPMHQLIMVVIEKAQRPVHQNKPLANKSSNITICLPLAWIEQLDQLAEANQVSRSQVVRRAIKDFAAASEIELPRYR